MVARAEEVDEAPGSACGALDDLPPPGTVRWVASRKALVVEAVRDGRLSLDEACARYQLSGEEFLGWQRMIERHGVKGLCVTRLRTFRSQAR